MTGTSRTTATPGPTPAHRPAPGADADRRATPAPGTAPVERLVLVGSVIVDTAVDVPALPGRGGDVIGSGLRSTPGGGFNVLAAARRLGLPAALAGHVGDGPNGLLVRTALAELGVERLVDTPPGDDTGGCVVLVEPDGERTFVTAPGVESRLAGEHLGPVTVNPTDAVHVSGYELLYEVSGPTIVHWLDTVTPAVVVLDPGPLVADIPRARLDAVLARTTVLTLNARELSLLGAMPGGDLASLHAHLAPGGVVVARDGANGAHVHDGERVVHVPAPAVTALDTTGAGDTHTGALLASLADGMTRTQAVARANAAAAWSVTRRGGATGPTRAELAASWPSP